MQLAFDLYVHSDASLDNFVLGSNALVVNALKDMASGLGDQYCFIWAEKGDGLSHLLQAISRYAEQQAVQSLYLPLKELINLGPEVLRGVDAVSLVCLDDIDSVAGDAAWEEALFYTFNRLRDHDSRLLVGAHHIVSACGFQLQDLVSRLSWGGAYHLSSLNDESKLNFLQCNAKRRGFKLPLEVARYLLTHYPRDMRTQLRLLGKLDALSLQEKHKITLPFVRAFLK